MSAGPVSAPCPAQSNSSLAPLIRCSVCAWRDLLGGFDTSRKLNRCHVHLFLREATLQPIDLQWGFVGKPQCLAPLIRAFNKRGGKVFALDYGRLMGDPIYFPFDLFLDKYLLVRSWLLTTSIPSKSSCSPGARAKTSATKR